MSADYPSDWDSRRQSVYKRDNYSCQNCGSMGGPQGHSELHAHHIVPKSRGGTHATSNLITLCKECHNTVHSKSKQAPAPQHSQAGIGLDTGVDYGELSDAIVADMGNVLGLVADNLHTSMGASIDEQANHWQTLANEIRPAILELTDVVEIIEDTSTADYPNELVQHDEKLIEEMMELCVETLELLELGGDRMRDVAEDMRSCPECGKEVNIDEMEFCVNCGKELSVTLSCPSCGDEVLSTDDFCGSCGEELGEMEDKRGIAEEVKEIESELEEMMEEIEKDATEVNDLIEKRKEIIQKHATDSSPPHKAESEGFEEEVEEEMSLDEFREKRKKEVKNELDILSDKILDKLTGENRPSTSPDFLPSIRDTLKEHDGEINSKVVDLLHNKHYGVGYGDKNNQKDGEFEPSENPTSEVGTADWPITLFLLTEEKLVFIVNKKQDEDTIVKIPYSEIDISKFHSGWTKNRIEVQTSTGEDYHLWIPNKNTDYSKINKKSDIGVCGKFKEKLNII